MRYRRDRTPGGTYFFTAVTARRRPLLVAHIDVLRKAFRYVLGLRPFQLDAIVVLPDHLHTVWTLPMGDADYSVRWMLLKREFSRAVPRQIRTSSERGKRELGVWQRRFWEHRIRNHDDLTRHLEYMYLNPVKHGLCDTPEEWPHRSFHPRAATGRVDESRPR
jgi:putative transposase